MKHLEAHPTVKMVRLKNYFSQKNLDAAHFRRLGITLALPLPNMGDIVHYVELQVHINAIFAFKHDNSYPHVPKCRDLNTGPYTYFRTLFQRDVKVMDEAATIAVEATVTVATRISPPTRLTLPLLLPPPSLC